MKTKQFKRYFLSIAMIAILLLIAGNAFAFETGALHARDNVEKFGYSNNFMVMSPYWQVDGGSYTFIAVSHSSLSGMASQIGLTINAITSAGTAYDTAETFTISSGVTQRIFIIPTNHATINSTTVESAKFLAGTSDFTYGHVRVNPQASHPMMKEGGILGIGKNELKVPDLGEIECVGSRARELIDGNGADRIIRIIQKYL